MSRVLRYGIISYYLHIYILIIEQTISSHDESICLCLKLLLRLSVPEKFIVSKTSSKIDRITLFYFSNTPFSHNVLFCTYFILILYISKYLSCYCVLSKNK